MWRIVGKLNTAISNNLVNLAGATNLDRFVPDADHINALLEPLRRYIHNLAARSCGRRGRNRIAEGEQQGGAVRERATSPVTPMPLPPVVGRLNHNLGCRKLSDGSTQSGAGSRFQMPNWTKGIARSMRISSDLFNAFLECSTKCWLRATGEPALGNPYAEWIKSENRSYHVREMERILSETQKNDVAVSPTLENLKAAKWRLAVNLAVSARMNTCILESEVHVVECAPCEGRGKPTQFIPIRFIFTNKLSGSVAKL